MTQRKKCEVEEALTRKKRRGPDTGRNDDSVDQTVTRNAASPRVDSNMDRYSSSGQDGSISLQGPRETGLSRGIGEDGSEVKHTFDMSKSEEDRRRDRVTRHVSRYLEVAFGDIETWERHQRAPKSIRRALEDSQWWEDQRKHKLSKRKLEDAEAIDVDSTISRRQQSTTGEAATKRDETAPNLAEDHEESKTDPTAPVKKFVKMRKKTRRS